MNIPLPYHLLFAASLGALARLGRRAAHDKLILVTAGAIVKDQ